MPFIIPSNIDFTIVIFFLDLFIYSNFDIFSQMDVRYRTIQSSYTISILYAGIYIADVCMLNHMYERYKKLF